MLTSHAIRSVAEFHRKHDAPVASLDPEIHFLRKSLIYEEAGELLLALHDQNEIELVDAMGDLLYVAAGYWVALNGDVHLPDDEKHPWNVLKDPLWSPEFKMQVVYLADTVVLNCCGINAALVNAIHAAIQYPMHLGYDIEGIFDEIHASNMTKTPTKGDIRVRVKGPDYRAPDVTRFLRGR